MDIPPEASGVAPGRARLRGRRVLVVGAGTRRIDDPDPPIGNGRAIALLAAREGAAVACADAEEAAARETLERIREAGGRGSVIVADVRDADACERMVSTAEEALGGLDGIVLNVGTAIGGSRGLAGTDAASWDATFAINLRSHFLVARAALPRLSPGASMVFVGSVAGRRPGSGHPAYDATKAGVEALCRHCAREGASRGLRANVVVPGLIDTPIGRDASRDRASRATTPIPLGRQGTGWEIAYATIFLLSDEASYITGQSLVVDGGLTTLL